MQAQEFKPTMILRKTIEELDPQTEEIFDQEFMHKFTEYKSFKHFIGSGNWLDGRGKLSRHVTVEDANEIVEEHTQFDSWGEMLEAALREWWSNPKKNRRRYERHSCNVDVTVDLGADQIPAKMVDISKNGLQLVTNSEIPNVRMLKILVPIKKSKNHTRTMVIRGAVRWKTDSNPKRAGLEIFKKEKMAV